MVLRFALPLGRFAFFAAIVALSTVDAAPALAGNGLALVGQSARMAGRGGASMAVADDALAAAHNPALLVELEHIRLDAAMIWFGERVREVDAFGDDLDESFESFPLPIFSMSWDPLGHETEIDGELVRSSSDLRIGLSLFQPVALVFAPTVTLSVRASDTFSFGLSLHGLVTFLSFESDGAIGGSSGTNDYRPNGTIREHFEADGSSIDPPRPFPDENDPITWGEVFDIVNSGAFTGGSDPNDPPTRRASTNISVENVVGTGVAGSVGMLWRPHPDFAIGFAARTPGVIFNPRGRGKIDLTDAIEAVRESPTVGVILDSVIDTYLPDRAQQGLRAEYKISSDRIKLPATVALGFAWYPTDWLLLAADVRWINWSQAFDNIDIVASGGENRDFNEINGGSTINYRYRLEWRDQWIFALGASVGVTDWLTLRAGFNHGQNPIPRKTASANSLVIENHVTIGAGLQFDRWNFDVAYIYGLPVEVELDDSVFKAEQHLLYVGIGYQF